MSRDLSAAATGGDEDLDVEALWNDIEADEADEAALSAFSKELDSDVATQQSFSLLQNVQSREPKLYSGFTQDDLLSMAQVFSVLSFKSGDQVLEKDEPASFYGIILEGTFDAVITPTFSVPLTVGAMLGEMAFFEGGFRSATVLAKTEGVLAIMQYEELRNLQMSNPDLQLKLVHLLSMASIRKLRKTIARNQSESDKKKQEEERKAREEKAAKEPKKKEALFRIRLKRKPKAKQPEGKTEGATPPTKPTKNASGKPPKSRLALLENKLKQLKEVGRKLKQAYTKLQGKETTARKRIAVLEAESDKLNVQLEEKTKALSALQANSIDADAAAGLNAEVRELRETQAAHQQTVHQLTTDLAAAKNKCISLQNEYEKAERERALAERARTIALKEKEITDKEEQIELLRLQSSSLRRKLHRVAHRQMYGSLADAIHNDDSEDGDPTVSLGSDSLADLATDLRLATLAAGSHVSAPSGLSSTRPANQFMGGGVRPVMVTGPRSAYSSDPRLEEQKSRMLVRARQSGRDAHMHAMTPSNGMLPPNVVRGTVSRREELHPPVHSMPATQHPKDPRLQYAPSPYVTSLPPTHYADPPQVAPPRGGSPFTRVNYQRNQPAVAPSYQPQQAVYSTPVYAGTPMQPRVISSAPVQYPRMGDHQSKPQRMRKRRSTPRDSGVVLYPTANPLSQHLQQYARGGGGYYQ